LREEFSDRFAVPVVDLGDGHPSTIFGQTVGQFAGLVPVTVITNGDGGAPGQSLRNCDTQPAGATENRDSGHATTLLFTSIRPHSNNRPQSTTTDWSIRAMANITRSSLSSIHTCRDTISMRLMCLPHHGA